VRVFNKRLPKKTVNNSFVATLVSLFLVLTTSFVLFTSFKEYGGNLNQEFIKNSNNEISYSFVDLLFEVASAFGTTGLSTGITSQISLISKLLLIVLMFIGQLGVSSSLLF
jgi:Trk-type K+ transport system membrane component